MSLPEDVSRALGNLKRFNDALTKLEDSLEPYFNEEERDKNDKEEKLALEEGREKLMALFTLDSLVWSLSNLREVNPSQDSHLSAEMKRTKKLMSDFKKQESRRSVAAPRINKNVTKAFVRNALFELSEPSTSKVETETKQQQSMEVQDIVEEEEVKIEKEVQKKRTTTTSKKITKRKLVKVAKPELIELEKDADEDEGECLEVIEVEAPAKKKKKGNTAGGRKAVKAEQHKPTSQIQPDNQSSGRSKASDFF